jgi:hypothetical protein
MIKLTKYLLGIIFCFVLTVATNILNGQNLKVKVYNYTRYDIDSLVIGKVFVGHLKKFEATPFLNLTELHFDSGIPYDSISGIVKGIKLTQLWWEHECGSGYSKQTEGTLFFDLRINRVNLVDYLELETTREE